MRPFRSFVVLLILLGCNTDNTKKTSSIKSELYDGPIIDMHLHADGENDIPPVKMGFCTPVSTMLPYYDTREEFIDVWDDLFANPKCDNPFWSPKDLKKIRNRINSTLS